MKNLFLIFLLSILSAMALAQSDSPIIGKEEFSLMSRNDQREFIMRVQHLVIQMEKSSVVFDLQHKNSPKKKVVLEKLKHLKNLYQMLLNWEATATELAGFEFAEYLKTVPPSLRCTWNGYPAIKIHNGKHFLCTVPQTFSEEAIKTTCANADPAYGIAKHSFCTEKNYDSFKKISTSLSAYYKQSATCSTDQIACNPQLFGQDSAGKTFCTERKRNGDSFAGVNSALQCMQSSLKDEKTIDKMAQNILDYNNNTNPTNSAGKFFMQMSQVVYSLCVCHDSPILSGQNSKVVSEWQGLISPAQDCLSFINFSRKVFQKVKADSNSLICLSSDTSIGEPYLKTDGAVSLGQYANQIDETYKKNLLARIEGAKQDNNFSKCLGNTSDEEDRINKATSCFVLDAQSFNANKSVMTDIEKKIAASKAYQDFPRGQSCPLKILAPNCTPTIAPGKTKNCAGEIDVAISCPEKADEPLKCKIDNGPEVDCPKTLTVGAAKKLIVKAKNGPDIPYINTNPVNSIAAPTFSPPSGTELTKISDLAVTVSGAGKLIVTANGKTLPEADNEVKLTLDKPASEGEIKVIAKLNAQYAGQSCPSQEVTSTYKFKPIPTCTASVVDSSDCGDTKVKFTCEYAPDGAVISLDGGNKEAWSSEFTTSKKDTTLKYTTFGNDGVEISSLNGSVAIPIANGGIKAPVFSPEKLEITSDEKITITKPDGIDTNKYDLSYSINGGEEVKVGADKKEFSITDKTSPFVLKATITAKDQNTTTGCKTQSETKSYSITKATPDTPTPIAISTASTATTTPAPLEPTKMIAPNLPTPIQGPNLVPVGTTLLDGVL